MTDYKVSVGDVTILSASDGTFQRHGADLFPSVTDAEWQEYADVLSTDGKLTTNYGSFVVQSQGENILVDTGMGPALPGRLLEDLNGKGVAVSDITTVVLTHLHPDHVGWNISVVDERINLTFPSARYRVPQKDLEQFRKSPHVQEQIVPLENFGVLDLMESETSITSEVTMVSTPGHTPGHMSVSISSRGERAFILGDVIVSPLQVHETAWELTFDSDKEQAKRTREAVIDELERNGILVGAGHFLTPSFGRFVKSKGRRYWQGI